jgi:anti-sigma regulatory factor (Ser/Thr protein kinase)
MVRAGDATMSAAASLDGWAGGYRHEAFLYSGLAEFAARTKSFIGRAVDAGDPVLAVVAGSKIDMLRRELGAAARAVQFTDMATVGANPGRLLARWQAFAQAHAAASRLWGIGEPVHAGLSPAELAESHLHEALLNVAFDASTPLWLLCPYDLQELAAEVIEEAHRNHPYVARGDERRPSGAFRPLDPASPFARPLPVRPPDAAWMQFASGDFGRVRAFVAQHAADAGLGSEPAAAMVAAVHELATNSVRHGGGDGELRIWTDGGSLVCEVSDRGRITAPLAGRLPPDPDAGGGAGLWVVNQLCDLVQIRSVAEGTAIRVWKHQ